MPGQFLIASCMNECFKPNACKQTRIIEAAVAEFQDKGFAAASMDRISARSEVSKRTLYKYFESKENLFRSIVEELSNRFAGMMKFRYRPGIGIRQQLTDLAWAEGRQLMSPQVIAMARMIISETLRSPDLAQSAQGKLDQHRIFEEVLRAAVEDGQLAIDDTAEAATEFLGLIKAKAFWPMMMGAPAVSEARMTEIVERSVEVMLSRYGRPGD